MASMLQLLDRERDFFVLVLLRTVYVITGRGMAEK
jgi:hypothetical protein